jgi:adenosylmethionine-8-amino-7-oxononanoate aminotransferase
MTNFTSLLATDREHLLHPLHHPSDYETGLYFTRGEGILLHATDGRQYIDGLSGLWNVLIGHGNQDLAETARKQMEELAFCSSYIGATSLPTIELAQTLAGFAYPSLNMTYFTSGGGEANESAFKMARYYWKRKGKPDKVKVIAREHAYHGVTLATMSATGIAPYWPMFEPRVPNFLHIPAPYPYRFSGELHQGETIGLAAARALEEAILKEGPDTVGAFIAEPVQGAGGVIIPPDDYFPRVREICDQYEVLFIADEIITGFGRTGKWFGLQHWDVEPDIMSFAKGVTSGYLPLGGIQISDEIREVIQSAPPQERWMHAYTYSGHPTYCAVGLKNIEILKQLNVVENAAKQGARLLAGLETLKEIPIVGETRGLGLMCGVELVADRKTRAPAGIGATVRRACQQRGLFTRMKGDILILAPPLIVTDSEIDEILHIVNEVLSEATGI